MRLTAARVRTLGTFVAIRLGSMGLAYFIGWMFGGYYPEGREQSYIAKLPTTDPTDGVDRTTFISKTITLSGLPGGTTNVLVRSGYQEFGADYTNSYCISRRDDC